MKLVQQLSQIGRSRFRSLSRWVSHTVVPGLFSFSEGLVDSLTREQGSEHWSALTPSRRWSSTTIWTLVSVAGFGIVWSCFAKIDETVQAVGKIEPLGTTLDVS